MEASEIAAALHDLCSDANPFDFNSLDTLIDLLEGSAKQLATSPNLRAELGQHETLWADLASVWSNLADVLCDRRDSVALRQLALETSRFTRNIVAGVPSNQIGALESENSMRRIVHTLTAFFRLQDVEYTLILATLVQALSNILTGNTKTQDTLWPAYMQLHEEDNILLRLLASGYPRAELATMILILNCTKDSQDRSQQLVSSRAGLSLCKSMLDHVNTQMEAEEAEEARTLELRPVSILYEVFRNIFQLGLFPTLWTSLINQEEFLTPHQTVLLKLLDAYLQLSTRSNAHDTAYTILLSTIYLQISAIALESIQISNPQQRPGGETVSVDSKLPKLVEADILIIQSLVSLLLSEADSPQGAERLRIVKKTKQPDVPSVVDVSIDLLRQLDLLIPRIILGKAQFSSGLTPTAENTSDSDPAGFAYIKRDLVRFLGILCHDDREVQDAIRERNGIQVIMNMCVVDERAPYLREHALFTLRNLLHGNMENQTLVDEIKPMVNWDPEGNLVV